MSFASIVRRRQQYVISASRLHNNVSRSGPRPRLRPRGRAPGPVNLDASPAPAGNMTVVLGNGWPGILLHEAIGHGLEGDFNRKGSSAFSGRVGERVAAEGVTVVDDGTLASRRGSLQMDDEGNPTQCTMLIENGILKGYLQDTLNARLMGVPVTGNARRESFAHLPMPRMTNTYMLNGTMIAGNHRIGETRPVCGEFWRWQVDITSGKFVFSASEAYMIENGKSHLSGEGRHPDRHEAWHRGQPDVRPRVRWRWRRRLDHEPVVAYCDGRLIRTTHDCCQRTGARARLRKCATARLGKKGRNVVLPLPHVPVSIRTRGVMSQLSMRLDWVPDNWPSAARERKSAPRADEAWCRTAEGRECPIGRGPCSSRMSTMRSVVPEPADRPAGQEARKREAPPTATSPCRRVNGH